jgi:hypothetical protein
VWFLLPLLYVTSYADCILVYNLRSSAVSAIGIVTFVQHMNNKELSLNELCYIIFCYVMLYYLYYISICLHVCTDYMIIFRAHENIYNYNFKWCLQFRLDLFIWPADDRTIDQNMQPNIYIIQYNIFICVDGIINFCVF